MGTPNYAKLVRNGRVKAIGVAWSDEEMKARYEFNIPAEFVRRGALTVEDYEKLQKKDEAHEKKHGEKPLGAMTRGELQAKVKESTPHITNEAPTEVLLDLATKAEKGKPAKKVVVRKKRVSKKKKNDD